MHLILFIADEERKKETNKLKQELYRFELSKQIEEKRRLEQEQKRKDRSNKINVARRLGNFAAHITIHKSLKSLNYNKIKI